MGSGASAQVRTALTELKGRRLVSSGSECGKTTIFKQMRTNYGDPKLQCISWINEIRTTVGILYDNRQPNIKVISSSLQDVNEAMQAIFLLELLKCVCYYRVLHMNGFTKDDIIGHRTFVHQNAIEALAQLIAAAEKFHIFHDTDVNEDIVRFQKFRENEKESEEIIIPFVMGRVMERIWRSTGIQKAYEHRFRFSLLDSAKYFLDDLSRLTEDIYTPTTQDILHCRNRTTGINELNFDYKEITFRMVDVGGQRTERRKWIHCFDNVDMILFVASMSDYDLHDPEDNKMNRMMQNFEIFKTICTSDFFNHASIVLFLNKFDIFCEKLKFAPLAQCWTNYEGPNEGKEAGAYVEKQFRKCVKNKQRFFNFLTTATDTNNIDRVFGSAVAHIVSENLKATGLQE